MGFGFPEVELCFPARTKSMGLANRYTVRNQIENGEIDDLLMHRYKAVCSQSCIVYHGNKLTCLTSSKTNQNKNVVHAEPHLTHSRPPPPQIGH